MVGPSRRRPWLLALLAQAALAGCVHQLARPSPPEGCPRLRVEGDRLLCAGKVFAEVERFGAGAGGCTGLRGYHGLAVRYASGERAWLHRVGSMDPDHPESYRGPRSDGEFKLGWVADVQIAPDGRKLHFRKPGLFSPDRFEYDVLEGTLRTVEWTEPGPAEQAPCVEPSR